MRKMTGRDRIAKTPHSKACARLRTLRNRATKAGDHATAERYARDLARLISGASTPALSED